MLLDNSDKKEPWRMKMTIYTASGMVRMGEIEKLTPDTGATNAAATAEAPAAEETFDETTASAEKS